MLAPVPGMLPVYVPIESTLTSDPLAEEPTHLLVPPIQS